MKTLALSLLVVLALGVPFGAAGCGGSSGSDDEPTPTPEPPAIHDLSGKILARDGSPIADASITVRTADGADSVLVLATSDVDGRYSVRIAEETPFYLHVEKAAYVKTNSHVRELTASRTGANLILFLQVQADSLIADLGGPTPYVPTNVLFVIQAVDAMGAEMADVNVNVTPIGLLVQYRLADATGFTNTGPTAACTAPGGCLWPHMAGFSTVVDQGASIFRMTPVGMVPIAEVVALLKPGELTYVAND